MAASKLQVLLVEDQDANINAWKDKAEAHNSDADAKGFAIESRYARSVGEARALLDTHKFDAVVVDLRLNSDDGGQGQPNDHGNVLVKHVVATHPVAMAIYSGQGKEADVTDCPQVEVFDRGDGLNPVFDWLARQCGMVTHLQATRTAIERETARIFFRSIWPRWAHWTKDGSPEALRDTLARHVVAHVHDSMLYFGGEKAHPEETYFVPPLKNRLDTGDLIRDDAGNVWVVVSPRCDLANPARSRRY
jgi:CheY-like chemotaxis protein